MSLAVILLIVTLVISCLHLTYTVTAKPVSNIIKAHKTNAAIIKQLTVSADPNIKKEIADILNK